jgi:hypothetical protein
MGMRSKVFYIELKGQVNNSWQSPLNKLHSVNSAKGLRVFSLEIPDQMSRDGSRDSEITVKGAGD